MGGGYRERRRKINPWETHIREEELEGQEEALLCSTSNSTLGVRITCI